MCADDGGATAVDASLESTQAGQGWRGACHRVKACGAASEEEESWREESEGKEARNRCAHGVGARFLFLETLF